MWVFIATETLFFGALMFTYFIYRYTYPKEFAHAAQETVLWCGTLNIGLLLTSSLTMVLAIEAAAAGQRPSRAARGSTCPPALWSQRQACLAGSR